MNTQNNYVKKSASVTKHVSGWMMVFLTSKIAKYRLKKYFTTNLTTPIHFVYRLLVASLVHFSSKKMQGQVYGQFNSLQSNEQSIFVVSHSFEIFPWTWDRKKALSRRTSQRHFVYRVTLSYKFVIVITIFYAYCFNVLFYNL